MALIARPAKCCLQFLFLLLPTSVLSLISLINRSAGIFNLFDLGFVLLTGFLKSSFGFCSCLFSPLMLPLEGDCGIFGSFVINPVRRRFFFRGLRLWGVFRDLIDLR